MMRKTLRKRRNRKKTIRRKVKGAGNQIDACAKYKLRGVNTSTLPVPVKSDKGSLESLSIITRALSKIPPGDLLILKVGSNDSEAAIKEGSKGKSGTLFIEAPFVTTIPKGTTTTLLDIRNKAIMRQLSSVVTMLTKTLPDVYGHIVSISPAPEYYEFSWPFVPSMAGDNIENLILYETFTKNVKSETYVQTFFPVAPGDVTDPSTQLLDMIVSREGPLLLFNAMGSLCFHSFKYIVDMRRSQGKITIYMGLVDVADMASCDLTSPVYPDTDKNCPQS